MRPKPLILAIASLGLAWGGCNKSTDSHSAGGDLKQICDLATHQVLAKGLTAESYAEFAKQGRALQISSPIVAQAWTAFLNAPPQRRYGFVEDAAEKVGAPGWSCEALRQLSLASGG
ncbi:MAG TPA: hypothetical protein VH208_01770 [Myxococcaceae bacterium]|nr:hypothetical protein [Myxococcaceae bacterium]